MEGNYPDLKIIDTSSKNIKKEQMLELQQNFSLKPLYGKYLIYIIKDASLFNQSSANTILKFLEEPNSNIIAILLTDNIYNCLETIVSRCQILSLQNEGDSYNKKIFKTYYEGDNLDCYIKKETAEIIDYYRTLENKKTSFLLEERIYQYKEKIGLLLQVGLYFYMECLKVKIGLNSSNFNDYYKEIKEIVEKNEINDIINKIDIINQFIENNKFNINKELFLDNFIITFAGGVNEN